MNREKKKQEKEFTVKKNYTHIEAPKLMNSLSGELKKGHPVKITFKAIDSVDLTSLQLLASAIKSFKAEQLPLHISFSCNDEVSSLINNCGFNLITETQTTL